MKGARGALEGTGEKHWQCVAGMRGSGAPRGSGQQNRPAGGQVGQGLTVGFLTWASRRSKTELRTV